MADFGRWPIRIKPQQRAFSLTAMVNPITTNLTETIKPVQTMVEQSKLPSWNKMISAGRSRWSFRR